ncbi:hypothetical protein GX50_05188 [[Emmonsia] crescens]|uniref:Uncharacterized protein n=1 Tax=[Emmonsia] crescens TaxID=73230 RepID=A0A2B7Z6I3_9EURO|nr:hypothetical protein GX50_05188 [Emmonsia crescens]
MDSPPVRPMFQEVWNLAPRRLAPQPKKLPRLKFTWTSPHDPAQSRVRKAPRHHARDHVHVVMETKVETASGATLDLHQEGDKVIDAFNSDGYVIFKGAADTDSMEEAIENRPVRQFLTATGSDFKCISCQHIVNSVIEKSAIDRSPQWKRLSEKTEVIAVTCFHLLGDDSSCWEWEYDTGGRGEALGRTKAVSTSGRDVIMCNGWLANRFPKSKGKKIDLYQLNYLRTNYNWT